MDGDEGACRLCQEGPRRAAWLFDVPAERPEEHTRVEVNA